MATDAQGNDLSAVNVPVGGLIAFAPYQAANVLPDTTMKTAKVTLPGAYRLLGLVKADGAPQHARESKDPMELWQSGYLIPGEGTRTFKVGVAENNVAVMVLTEGKEPDANGIIYVDSSLPDARWIVFAATKFKNGTEERYNGVAQVTAIEVDQDERGSVRGRTVTLTWQEDDLFNGAPFKMWNGVAAGSQTTPTVTAASPASAAAGAAVTISGTGFLSATGVKFGSTNATVFQIVSDTQIVASMPPGSAGSAAVVVVKGALSSNSFAYTRG